MIDATFNRYAKQNEAKSHRTRIEDIPQDGYELSEEEIRLVSGGAARLAAVSTCCAGGYDCD